MEVRLIIMALICLGIAQLAFAVEDSYPFSSSEKQARFINLTKELRCTACQNQSLFDSSASLAIDIRAQIYKMLNANESDTRIRNYLVDRYGDFVLFTPPWRVQTAALWFGPLFMLAIALFLAFRFIKTPRNY